MFPTMFNEMIGAGLANLNTVSRLFVDHAQRIAQEQARLHSDNADKWQEAITKTWSGSTPADAWQSYATDAGQRALLTLDVLRERGNAFNAHVASGMPPVLDFAYQTVIDGRTLVRPVNYTLVVITPPAGVTIDPARRPFMIVDPRAGHGAGIGGFK